MCIINIRHQYSSIVGAYLCPRVCFDLWEFELCVVGVHLSDLLPCWCPQNLTNTNEKLIFITINHSYRYALQTCTQKGEGGIVSVDHNTHITYSFLISNPVVTTILQSSTKRSFNSSTLHQASLAETL